jgi:hypothetical protein
MRVDGVYIELVAAEPEQLAAFYERLGEFERATVTPGNVLLRSSGLILAIRRSAAPAPDPPEGTPVFGFVLRAENGPDALREELAAAGAVILSESKRDGRRTFSCSDPAGNEFSVLVDQAALPAGPSQALATSTSTTAAPVSGADPKLAEPSAPASTPRQEPRRYTRRDLDRLRDMERLAQMQETIAGLDVAFGPTDPASVLDDMRSKVGPGFATTAADEHDAALRQQQRLAEADSLLERYKRDVHGSGEPPAPATDAPKRPEDAVADDVGLGRIRRSLGGTGESDE